MAAQSENSVAEMYSISADVYTVGVVLCPASHWLGRVNTNFKGELVQRLPYHTGVLEGDMA